MNNMIETTGFNKETACFNVQGLRQASQGSKIIVLQLRDISFVTCTHFIFLVPIMNIAIDQSKEVIAFFYLVTDFVHLVDTPPPPKKTDPIVIHNVERVESCQLSSSLYGAVL
jgi:hypothetical protein